MNIKSLIFSILIFGLSAEVFTQVDTSHIQSETVNKKRLGLVLGTNTLITGTTIWFLWDNWFTSEPLRSFHFSEDHNHWLQMDKMGHAFSAYYISNIWSSELRWANVSRKKSAIYGSLASWISVTSIDVMDGFSAKWGFSYSDFIANTVGTGLFLGQELLWEEQRIRIKWSYHSTEFPEFSDRLGEGWTNEWLHDYNGQTYWLSANLNAFFKNRNIPKLLNIAVGYGAENMITDLESEEELLFNNQRNQRRIRQFYLSPDLDLTKIKTNSKFVKILLEVVNAIKIPMPTLEYNKADNFKFHFLYF